MRRRWHLIPVLAGFALPVGFARAASVPDVVAGPDLAAEATAVEAPVAHVTVFSDRARVKRRGRVALKGGPMALRLPDLPGAVRLDTVRVSAGRARVLRVETVPVERPVASIDQVESLLDEIEQLSDRIEALDIETAADRAAIDRLDTIRPQPAVAEQHRVGKALPKLDIDRWLGVVDFLDRRRTQHLDAIRKRMIEREASSEVLWQKKRELDAQNLGAFSDRRIQVLAVVDGRGQVDVEIEYFMPGALWRPAYEIDYDADAAKLVLRTAGLVQQSTGEDWPDVGVALSTAIPGQGIELPELLTWTLGEKRDFVPRPRAQ